MHCLEKRTIEFIDLQHSGFSPLLRTSKEKMWKNNWNTHDRGQTVDKPWNNIKKSWNDIKKSWNDIKKSWTGGAPNPPKFIPPKKIHIFSRGSIFCWCPSQWSVRMIWNVFFQTQNCLKDQNLEDWSQVPPDILQCISQYASLTRSICMQHLGCSSLATRICNLDGI